MGGKVPYQVKQLQKGPSENRIDPQWPDPKDEAIDSTEIWEWNMAMLEEEYDGHQASQEGKIA